MTSSSRQRLSAIRRRSVQVSSDSLITAQTLASDRLLPLVVQPNACLDLAAWAETQAAWIKTKLHHHGGLLFRGFDRDGIPALEPFLQALGGNLLDYSYRSTPRTQVSGKVYTSTEYPASQTIPLHNEMAYSRQWPLRIAFLCLQPAVSGGMTPIADSRQVYDALPPELRSRWQQQQILYVRNYGGSLDLPWQTVFQTDDPAAVEAAEAALRGLPVLVANASYSEVPEWGGQRVDFRTEEDAFFDGESVRYLDGRQTELTLIGEP